MGTNGVLHLPRKSSAPFCFGQYYSWRGSKLETVFSFNSQTSWKTKEKECLTFHWSQWFLSLFALYVTSVLFGRKGRACDWVGSVCFHPRVRSSPLSSGGRCSLRGAMGFCCVQSLSAFLPISGAVTKGRDYNKQIHSLFFYCCLVFSQHATDLVYTFSPDDTFTHWNFQLDLERGEFWSCIYVQMSVRKYKAGKHHT